MRKLLLILLMLSLSVSTVSAVAPTIELVYPNNGATGISVTDGSVTLKVNVTDSDSDLQYIAFQTNRTGSWVDIATVFTAGTNWTENMPVIISGLTYNTVYWWRIASRDAEGNWTNATFSFATAPEIQKYKLDILPSQPKAGKNILFYTDAPDTTGYIFVNETGNLYLVNIKDGLGMVQLSTDDYGEAQVIIPKYATKNFTILSPYEGELSIGIPTTADLNSDVEISVFARGQMIANTIQIVSPSGRETYKTTSTLEPLVTTFKESGNWTVTTNYYNTVATAYININSMPLSINVDNSCCLEANKEVKITVNAESADVQIKKDAQIWDYVTSENGELYFTPTASGRYTITATSGTQTGTEYFYVKSKAYIWVKDDKGYQVSSISKGETLFLQVTDALGNNLPGSSINIILDDDQLNPITVPLSGGSGMWTADRTANKYTFSFLPEDANQYLPATSVVTGAGEGFNWTYAIIGIVAVAVIIVLYILYRRGLIKIPFRGGKEDWESWKNIDELF